MSKNYLSLGCSFCFQPSDAIRGEEGFHRDGNFYNMCLKREVSGIEELDLRIRQVPLKGLCSRGNEEGIIFAPDRKKRRFWTCGNIPGISDTAPHSTHNPETNRAGSLCCVAVRAEPYPTCRTQAEQPQDSSRRGDTASAFLPLSELFGEVCPCFLLSARPNTSESDPRHRQGLLRRRSRFAKRWL